MENRYLNILDEQESYNILQQELKKISSESICRLYEESTSIDRELIFHLCYENCDINTLLDIINNRSIKTPGLGEVTITVTSEEIKRFLNFLLSKIVSSKLPIKLKKFRELYNITVYIGCGGKNGYSNDTNLENEVSRLIDLGER